jgi:hypothetical protein
MHFRFDWKIVFAVVFTFPLIAFLVLNLSCEKKTTDSMLKPPSIISCSVSPQIIDFGTVYHGTYKDTTFTITNESEHGMLIGTLRKQSQGDCNVFQILSDTNYVVIPGETIGIKIRFDPRNVPNWEVIFYCTIETGHEVCQDVFCFGESVWPFKPTTAER